MKVFQFEARGLSLILHLRPEVVFEPPAQASPGSDIGDVVACNLVI